MSQNTGAPRPAAEGELQIGVFGPRSLTRAIIDAGAKAAAASTYRVRFVNGIADTSDDVHARYEELADRVNAAVFPGPLLFDLARGYLRHPASHVQLKSSALLSTIISGMAEGDVDPHRLSVDSLSEMDVRDAYSDMRLDSSGIFVREYDSPRSVEEFASFHRELYRTGQTSAALTTVLDVEKQLRAEGVPVFRIRPTRAAMEAAVEMALALASGHKVRDQNLVMVAISMMLRNETTTAGRFGYWQQEALLSLHQVLLEEARMVDATLVRRSDDVFLVTTTVSGIATLTSQLTHAPFAQAVGNRLGFPVAIGVGAGESAYAAEVNALTAAARARDLDGAEAVYIDDRGAELRLGSRYPELRPASDNDTADNGKLRDDRWERLIRDLRAALLDSGSEERAFGAEELAEVSGVTPRSARRTIQQMVEAGLLWPLPVARPAGAGRPRQLYKLLPSKMSTE